MVSALVVLLPVSVMCSTVEYRFKPVDKKADGISRRLYQMDFANRRDEINPKCLDSLDEMGKNSSLKQVAVRAVYWRVRMNQLHAQPSVCIPLLKKAIGMCNPDYSYDLALLKYQLAGNYERIGNYLKCYMLCGEAIEGLKDAGDDYFLGNAYLLMAQMFADINDLQSANEQLQLCKTCYEKCGYPLNRIYFFEALLLDNPHSLDLYKKSVATGGRDWGMTIQALSHISHIFLQKHQCDSAAYYVKLSDKVIRRYCPRNILFVTMLNISKVSVLYAQGKYKEALDRLEHIHRVKSQIKDETFMLDVYLYLWKVYDKLGDKDKSYDYLKQYQHEYEMNSIELRKQEVPKMRACQAIQKIEKEAETSRNYLYGIILIFIIVVLIVIVIFVYFYQRYRIRRIENRELRNNLQHESLIYSINRQNFMRDIEQKDREISSSTLLLTNKNEVLKQISDITKMYSDNGQIPIEYIRQVNEVIGDSLKNDDEWSRFRLHFDSVHPDFFNHLKNTCSELTENDLRLCAYIRIGMRAKQIAEMLNVTPDSINSNRYRLRKKLGLIHGESLDDFLRNV